MAAIPDWQAEEERVRALLGDQGNYTPVSQGGANPYAPTGAAEPNIDPNTGDFHDTYGYFNQSNIQGITAQSNAMQEALQKGDNTAYQAALNQYRQITGGLQPVWSYNITPESVAANAPHPNDPWNQAWDAKNNPAASNPSSPNVGNGQGTGGRGGSTGTTPPGGTTTPPGQTPPGNTTPPRTQTPPRNTGVTPPGTTPPAGRTDVDTRTGPQTEAPVTNTMTPYQRTVTNTGGTTPPGATTPPATGPSGIPNYGIPKRTTNTGSTPGGAGYGPSAFPTGVTNPASATAAGFGSIPFNFKADSTDPKEVLANDRNYAYKMGNQLIENFGQTANQQNQRGRVLGDLGDSYYSDLLENPGYDPADEAAIKNQAGLEGMQLSQADRDSNFLTGDEQGEMKGDPFLGQKKFDEQSQGVANAAAHYGDVLQDIYDTGSTDLNSATGRLSADLDSAIDPTALGLSDEYKAGYNFSPEDEQDMINQAGRTVGLAGQAQRDDLVRRSQAAGNTDPLGIAAAQERIQRTSDVGKADAMLNAKIAAKQLGLDVTGKREATRLGSEQDISNRRLDAAKVSGEADRANQQFLTSGRASAGLQTGAKYVDTVADNAKTTAGLASQGEAAAAQRAQAIAQNRQTVNQANQATDLDRKKYADQATSQRATQAADTARDDQATARLDIRREENQAYNQENSNNALATQTFAGVTGAGQASQGAAIKAAQIPSTVEKLISAGASAFARGGVVDKPTMARLGEEGPEMVVPLGGQAGTSAIDAPPDNARRYGPDEYPGAPHGGPSGAPAPEDVSNVDTPQSVDIDPPDFTTPSPGGDGTGGNPSWQPPVPEPVDNTIPQLPMPGGGRIPHGLETVQPDRKPPNIRTGYGDTGRTDGSKGPGEREPKFGVDTTFKPVTDDNGAIAEGPDTRPLPEPEPPMEPPNISTGFDPFPSEPEPPYNPTIPYTPSFPSEPSPSQGSQITTGINYGNGQQDPSNFQPGGNQYQQPPNIYNLPSNPSQRWWDYGFQDGGQGPGNSGQIGFEGGSQGYADIYNLPGGGSYRDPFFGAGVPLGPGGSGGGDDLAPYDLDSDAKGSIVTKPSLRRIGESGPEMVMKLPAMNYRRPGERMHR